MSCIIKSIFSIFSYYFIVKALIRCYRYVVVTTIRVTQNIKKITRANRNFYGKVPSVIELISILVQFIIGNMILIARQFEFASKKDDRSILMIPLPYYSNLLLLSSRYGFKIR